MPNRIDASRVQGLGFLPGPEDDYYSGHDASQEFPNVGNDIGSPPQNPVEGIPAAPESESIPQGIFNPGEGTDRGDAAIDLNERYGTRGLQYGRATPGQVLSGVVGVFGPPGLRSAVDYGVDAAGGLSGGIPAHEQYGAAGTVDVVSGGVFGADGRAYDSVTGEALHSYRDSDAFYGGEYAQGIQADPFSLDSYFSDPANRARNTAANQARAAGSRGAHDYLAATRGDRGLFADDELGNVPTDREAAELAQYIAIQDLGLAEHTAAPGTATNEAIQGIGYSDSGAAPAGSQFSSTGTFSSSHSDNNNNDSDDGWSGEAAAPDEDPGLDAFGGSGDDSGGGGGGK